MASADMAIVIITTISSFIMIISTCLLAVPEKHQAMKNVSIIWTLTQAVSCCWKLFDATYSSLPKDSFEFILSFPEFGRPEIIGAEALAITWSLIVLYILLFLWTLIILHSHLSNLKNQVSLFLISSLSSNLLNSESRNN